MGDIMQRLVVALNAHDLDALVDCFAVDYESDQPAHPNRRFRGRDQVRSNWESVFSGVPDFTAELLIAATTDDGVEIGEWRWRGAHTDGAPFGMYGLIVAGMERDLIRWARLSMEPIDHHGGTIDEMVRDTYRPGG